jgi:Tfp pilus assembly protein PilO
MNNDDLPTNNRFTRFRKYYQPLEPLINKPKNRIYTAIIFSFLAISLFGWYAIKPTIQTIITLRREIADKTEVNDKLEQKITTLIAAQAAYQEIQSQISIIDEAIPPNPEALDAVFQIRNLVNNTSATTSALTSSGVPFTIPKSTTPTTNNANNFVPFSLSTTVAGTYGSLENILSNLNNFRRMVVVDNFSMTPTSTEVKTASGSAGNLNMTLQLRSFYMQ